MPDNGAGPVVLSMGLCSRCKHSTTKIFGFDTGILRCGICSCVIWAKEKVGGVCPRFKDMDEYRTINGEAHVR